MSKLLEEQFEKRIAYFEEKKMYASENEFEKIIDKIRDINEALDELTQLEEMYIELLLLNVKYWRSDYVLKNINKTDLKCEILSDCCYMVDGLIKSPEKNKIIKKVQKIINEVEP